MKVEIWCDLLSPLCYVGKQRFENALNKFEQKDQVEVVWHSFQINTEIELVPGSSVDKNTAEQKGVPVAKRKEMMVNLSLAVKEPGIKFSLKNAFINNSLDAHRLLHFANKYGLQNQAREKLFSAFCVDGKNIRDIEILVQVAQCIGLDANEVRAMFSGDNYKQEVQQDQQLAKQMGVTRLPFFVFNNKYTVSGAQSTEVFTQLLAKVWEEEKPVEEEFAPFGFCSLESGCF